MRRRMKIRVNTRGKIREKLDAPAREHGYPNHHEAGRVATSGGSGMETKRPVLCGEKLCGKITRQASGSRVAVATGDPFR